MRPLAAALALCAGVWAADAGACADSARTLSLDDYRDKMKAAWVEQMVGVSWGQPMEFKWNDVIIPADKVPEWASDFPLRMAYGNDDLYVEMTFLKTLEDPGFDVSIRHDEPPRRRQDGGSPYGRASGTKMVFSSFCAEHVA